MAEDRSKQPISSFLGTGWGFPPELVPETGGVRMSSDEQDIEESLRILFGTRPGERLFEPTYGIDVRELLYQPITTTARSFFADRVKVAVLLFEPRIELLSLRIESPDPNDGALRVFIDYEIRATNARRNLVFPFYTP